MAVSQGGWPFPASKRLNLVDIDECYVKPSEQVLWISIIYNMILDGTKAPHNRMSAL